MILPKTINPPLPAKGRGIANTVFALDKLQGTESMKTKIPYILLVIFILFVIAGISLGEITKVLETAVNLCLGCIGIG